MPVYVYEGGCEVEHKEHIEVLAEVEEVQVGQQGEQRCPHVDHLVVVEEQRPHVVLQRLVRRPVATCSTIVNTQQKHHITSIYVPPKTRT